jgi:hypothetical protein
MPTEDYSHTRRIARVRQIAEWKGFNKVAGAVSSGIHLSMKVGGVVNIQKNFNGIGKTINNSVTFTNNDERLIIHSGYRHLTGSEMSISDVYPSYPISLGTFTSFPNTTVLLHNKLGVDVTVKIVTIEIAPMSWTLGINEAIVLAPESQYKFTIISLEFS